MLFLLIGASVSKKKKHKGLIEKFGVPFDPRESVEEEALGGKAGSSGFGGIESNDHWDDEVSPLEIGDGKVHLSDDEVVNVIPEMSYEDGLSIEELAGKKPVADVSSVEVSDLSDEVTSGPPSQVEEPQTPPVPEAGLPDGGTMAQWNWVSSDNEELFQEQAFWQATVGKSIKIIIELDE